MAGGVAIPVTLPTATASPTVEAYVGEDTVLHVLGNGNTNPDTATGRLEVVAIAADDPHADGTAAGAAVATGGGTGVFATNKTTLNAYVGDGATVTTNTDTLVKAEHEYVGYARGQGGDLGALAVNVNEATLDIEPTVQAYIASANVQAGGDVIIESESGTPGELPDLSFAAGTDIDYDANTITFERPHGLETGETVVYRANGQTPIGGLTDGANYQVIRVSDRTIQLGTFFTADQVDNDSGEIRFDNPHNLESGAGVVYDANGNPWINGLHNGLSYFVNALDASALKLSPTVEIADNEAIAAFNGHSAVNYETNEIRLAASYAATGESLSWVAGEVHSDWIRTQQKSTTLERGDAVLYAPDINAAKVPSLNQFAVYFIERISFDGNGYVVVHLSESLADVANNRTINLQSTGGGGELVGIDLANWRVSGAGVNTPEAIVTSVNGTTTIYAPADRPFPFVSGDQVSWVRSDGNYSDAVRFGLNPNLSYYVQVTTGNGQLLQLAETLADLRAQKFVELFPPADSFDQFSYLALQIPVQTGDALTYRAEGRHLQWK